ncbi:LpxI family protein [Celeribacter sp.]|uniref:LpxI family protein n=1 Tax=Celeribacter sp. TaxID=1890673 RepID=UPI003A93FD70
MTRTAIIAGSGQLPNVLAAQLDAPVFVTFSDMSGDQSLPDGAEPCPARIEKLGRLFKALKGLGVTEVCFAGAMARPKVNPVMLDTHALKLVKALGRGDDGVLREVIALFERQGFTVRGAAEIVPDLVLAAGTIWGRAPNKDARADIARASEVLNALSPLDVGQGAVAVGGQMLGIETLQGTRAMLAFVAQTPKHLRRAAGVFVKAPKSGQELRIDMPTIGPDTVEEVIAAGLGGIAIAADTVIVLDRAKVKARIEEAGLFLIAQ